MDRAGRPDVATFFAAEALVPRALVTLGEDAAHHMRVRRLEPGDGIALLDGAGRSGMGRLVKLAKSHAVVELGDVAEHAPPASVHLMVPVADRDRMLWLAEKAVELGVASWRPVLWRRSRSVASRGEGSGFQQKVRARMVAALAQSEGAWLPDVHPDATVERAAAAAPAGTRLVLDPDGEPLWEMSLTEPVTLAVGPEGGIEADELARLEGAGFRRAALPGNVLRFETAGVAGLVVALARLRAAGDAADAAALTSPAPGGEGTDG